MDETLEKMTIEELQKVLGHVVGLMERAERRAENENKQIFTYVPKYSILLKNKMREVGGDKVRLIEMIKVVYDDPYVRMLQAYEEAMGFKANTRVTKSESISEAPSPFSEAPSPFSPFSETPAMSPMSPSFLNTFNLAAKRAAKRQKRAGL
jgi:mRNA-degrading endonuclease HigB of HigAB toxin-antitoxin module